MEQSSASFGAWRKHILSPCMRVDTLYTSKVRRGRHQSHAEIGHPDAKSNVARLQPLPRKSNMARPLTRIRHRPAWATPATRHRRFPAVASRA